MKAQKIKRLSELEHNLKGEAHFLSGRHSRIVETFRLFRIVFEYIRGFRALQFEAPVITIFGSARFKEGTRWYDLAREVGGKLATSGYTVMTGGGPGVMEAANRGAMEKGGRSLGCNVILPHEQAPNRYLHKVVTFYYFFVRKVMLVKYSHAFIILPGGYGTLDEMTEALTLIQTGKLYDFPIILMGEEYWKGFVDWVQSSLVTEGAIASQDLKLFRVTDSADEAVQMVEEASRRIKNIENKARFLQKT